VSKVEDVEGHQPKMPKDVTTLGQGIEPGDPGGLRDRPKKNDGSAWPCSGTVLRPKCSQMFHPCLLSKGSPLCGSKKGLKTTILNKGFNKEKTPNILVEF